LGCVEKRVLRRGFLLEKLSFELYINLEAIEKDFLDSSNRFRKECRLTSC
jgi:hypothetical protein